MINLVSNSIKFTVQGSIVMSMNINWFDGKETISFEVQDTGVGISEQDQVHLFQEFGMGKSMADMNKNGTGLGLSICKKLVNALSGEIHFKTQMQVGTTFMFDIDCEFRMLIDETDPLIQDSKVSSFKKQLKLHHKNSLEHKAWTVLVVDDTFFNLDVVKTQI